ncbi:MAG: hypothetical protein GXY85_05385 [Candidatus Brocadiaceae bacterium]|nr:hypothetical protein [Candidatus Brocadiaceae bacterium]
MSDTVTVTRAVLEDLAALMGAALADPNELIRQAVDRLGAASALRDNAAFRAGLGPKVDDRQLLDEIAVLARLAAEDPARRLVFDAIADGRIAAASGGWWLKQARQDLEAVRAALAGLPRSFKPQFPSGSPAVSTESGAK